MNPSSMETKGSEYRQKFFFIHVKRKFVRIDIESIIYVLALAHHVKLCTDQGIFIPHLSLRQLEAWLPAEQFCRINKGTLVSIVRITAFTKDAVYLSGISFALSDIYWKELEQKINILIHQEG